MLSQTVNNENELDQFYTNQDVSLKCYSKLKQLISAKLPTFF